MPKPFPKEFREDVVRVARQRGPGVRLASPATPGRSSVRRGLTTTPTPTGTAAAILATTSSGVTSLTW
jgi:hypothetical protein